MANLKVNMSMTKNEMPEQDPVVRGGNFEEVALGYDAETARKALQIIARGEDDAEWDPEDVHDLMRWDPDR